MSDLRTDPRYAPARRAFALAVAEAAVESTLTEMGLPAEQRTIPQAVTAACERYPNAGRQATRTNRQEQAASPPMLEEAVA